MVNWEDGGLPCWYLAKAVALEAQNKPGIQVCSPVAPSHYAVPKYLNLLAHEQSTCTGMHLESHNNLTSVNPCLRVLSIPELLTLILTYLDGTRTLFSQRVNRAFRTAITASPALQRKLVFPSPRPRPTSRRRVRRRPVARFCAAGLDGGARAKIGRTGVLLPSRWTWRGGLCCGLRSTTFTGASGGWAPRYH